MTRNPSIAEPSDAISPASLALYSRFDQRVRRRYAELLDLLAAGLPSPSSLSQTYSALQSLGQDHATALRVLRQLVLARLLQLDCAGQATLEQVTQTMTELAEFALDQACTQVFAELDHAHGAPTTPSGERAQFWVVGMGKLGGRELNVSSDIDLIYVYDQDGETSGQAMGGAHISNQEYFAKAVRGIYSLIGSVTEHGFVFRVDLALRPNGGSGPPASSLSALETYFYSQAREWERFAWLKSRVVAPAPKRHDGSAKALRELVLPFVFRRYLDYNVFDALRDLHQKIRAHTAQRSTARPERLNDVKLSRGGIREIEFTVQLLQVVRGGQFPELRTRSTLKALQRLAQAGLMPQTTAQDLSLAYIFLRQVEHRIQYLDDQQTHVLPSQVDDLNWIARTLAWSDSAVFLEQLNKHRDRVAQEFDRLLGLDHKPAGRSTPLSAPLEFDDVIHAMSGALHERVAQCWSQPKVNRLSEPSRQRLLQLLARTARWVSQGRSSELAALRLTDWMEALLRRESYLALLLERPAVHERLLRLLGAARFPARYLQLHPGVIDELASPDLLDERFVAAEFEQELELRKQALQTSAEDHEEALLNLLRRAHHAEVFRTLARDLEGVLTVEQVGDELTALAEAVLRITLRWCWADLPQRHRDEPQVAILAYGKLGGKELGYGSDLDIVFVYDDEDERAGEIYARLARKMIACLSVKTGDGDLYEIDTALRPSGNSGLLVSSFQAFANYQQQRGSNSAWTWEHQAMTRARCVLGASSLRQRFDAVRRAVIVSPRDKQLLNQEITAMRDKMRKAFVVKAGVFDLKHSPGGMIDLEFSVQALVLLHAASHPELIANAGNIALLQVAESASLLSSGVGLQAANAYRELRRLQHRARLDEVAATSDPALLVQQRAAVLVLWHEVFG
ncbi:MAG: bifunctional [glutamate--ammonia ligase]-adenylyl-L-tyrosine phosphorylase/[glutamate--ammonia-ligase] adenylyltransferase [Burkholderiaceae bacterium]